MCKYCEYCMRKGDRGEVTIKYMGVKYKCIGDVWGFRGTTTIVYDPVKKVHRLWQDGRPSLEITKCPMCGRELKSPQKTVDKKQNV